jgi:DNA repair exonuclease SbcCD ATPase subunit
LSGFASNWVQHEDEDGRQEGRTGPSKETETVNEISLYTLREARLSALRGEVPALFAPILELVADAVDAAEATDLDELPSKIVELKDELEHIGKAHTKQVEDLTDERDELRAELKDAHETQKERDRDQDAELAKLRAEKHEWWVRACRAEGALEDMRRAMHSLSVTRRGNVLYVALPEALRVSEQGSQPWNTLAVPVLSERELSKGSVKRDPCPCCTTSATKHATTFLAWTRPTL